MKNKLISVEEFAMKKGLPLNLAIDMVRDGFFNGKEHNQRWYVYESQLKKEGMFANHMDNQKLHSYSSHQAIKSYLRWSKFLAVFLVLAFILGVGVAAASDDFGLFLISCNLVVMVFIVMLMSHIASSLLRLQSFQKVINSKLSR